MSDDLRGHVYPHFFVMCAECGEEVSLGTTERTDVRLHLERSGYRLVQGRGYVCEKCREKKARDTNGA